MASLDPSSHEVNYGGNVKLQCENGTFPECRSILARHLKLEVERKHLDQDEADKKLRDADALWEVSRKRPEVLEKLEERYKVKVDREDALCRACSNQIAELRGVNPNSLQVVIVEAEDIKKVEDLLPAEEEKPKRSRGRPKK